MSDNKKQMMDIQKVKSFDVAVSDEHQRNWNDDLFSRKENDPKYNYDRSRTRLNFQVSKGGKVGEVDKSRSITEKIEQAIKERVTGRVNATSNRAVSIIFGGNREQMRKLAFGDQTIDEDGTNWDVNSHNGIHQWAKDIYDFCCREFGENNIASFIVHLDELNPHAHVVIVPITKDGRLSAKDMFGGSDLNQAKVRMRDLHSRLAEVNEKFGLERGDDITLTGARHKSTETYRRELAAECRTLSDEVGTKKAILSDLNRDVAKAETRIKALQTMVSNLEKAEEEKQAAIAELEDYMKNHLDEAEEIKAKIKAGRKELWEIHDKISDKKMKLWQAKIQLEKLQKDVSKTTALNNEITTAFNKSVASYQQQIINGLFAQAGQTVLDEINNIYPHMISSHDRNLFDDSFAFDFINHGIDIINCAMILYIGYIDEATKYAESHGGGGSDTKDWGRDKDEEEQEWLRRCLRQATRMMKPRRGRGFRR